MPLRRCRPAWASGSTSTSTRSSETLGRPAEQRARHDVIVAIEALARDDDQQSHRCQESAARARRSGTPRRGPREQRYRLHRERATVSMPWLCSARPLPDHKQRRIPCPVSNDQPTAVRTIASALQLEHSLRAQSRQEHRARRPGRATAMRPGAIVRVRTRFDVQRRLSAQIPTVPLCAEWAIYLTQVTRAKPDDTGDLRVGVRARVPPSRASHTAAGALFTLTRRLEPEASGRAGRRSVAVAGRRTRVLRPRTRDLFVRRVREQSHGRCPTSEGTPVRQIGDA